MRNFRNAMFVLMLGATGCARTCGYTSRDNELIGQAKKIHHHTPIICPDFDDADISLGVMRNGVGSMSTQDMWLNVTNHADYDLLLKAIADGDIVKVRYDTYRATTCINENTITHVEIVK
jgi:hypothetical protein